MFYFLYQSPRHTPSWGNRSRYKQNSKRGDFNLDLLKKCIKGRFAIQPHGEHEVQKLLEEANLISSMYGHLVIIEDPKNALWLRLNYENIGKGSTKYVQGWRDLDVEVLRPLVKNYIDIRVEANTEYSYNARIGNCIRSVSDSINYLTRGSNAIPTEEIQEGLNFLENLKTRRTQTSQRYTDLQNQASAAQVRIQEYIDSKKFSF